MGQSGDLRAVLSLDDFEYITGMREATVETDKLAEHAEHTGHSLHRSLHKGAHLAGSFAFMSSEGKDIDSMKSKMEGVAMMAPMVGMAIGGWAGPIGVVVGVLGAALIPKLLEGVEGFKGIEEWIKKSEEAMNGLIKRTTEMIDFMAKLQAMNERKEFGKEKEGLDLAANKKRAEGQILKDELKRLQDQKEKIAAAKKDEANEPGFLAGAARFGKTIGNFGAVALTGELPEDPANKKVDEAIAKITKRMKELNAEQRQITEEKGKLAADLADKGETNNLDPKEAIEQSKKLLAEDEKRKKLAEKIGKELETPYERAVSRVKELQDAFKKGIIDQDALDRGSRKATEEYQDSQKSSGTNAAVVGASGESYKAIRESVKSQSKVDEEKIRLLKLAAEHTDKIRVGIDKIEEDLRSTSNDTGSVGIA